MTSTEVAIQFFEKHLKDEPLKYGERQAIHMAISALREQEERSKCEWCAKWKSATCPLESPKEEV